jgi:hypothetical protein
MDFGKNSLKVLLLREEIHHRILRVLLEEIIPDSKAVEAKLRCVNSREYNARTEENQSIFG